MFLDLLDTVLWAIWDKEENPLRRKQILRYVRWNFTKEPPLSTRGRSVVSPVWDELGPERKYFCRLKTESESASHPNSCVISDLTPN